MQETPWRALGRRAFSGEIDARRVADSGQVGEARPAAFAPAGRGEGAERLVVPLKWANADRGKSAVWLATVVIAACQQDRCQVNWMCFPVPDFTFGVRFSFWIVFEHTSSR